MSSFISALVSHLIYTVLGNMTTVGLDVLYNTSVINFESSHCMVWPKEGLQVDKHILP